MTLEPTPTFLLLHDLYMEVIFDYYSYDSFIKCEIDSNQVPQRRTKSFLAFEKWRVDWNTNYYVVLLCCQRVTHRHIATQ